MNTFLSLVAHDLYTRTNGDLSHTVVVFPGKRAGLFLNDYLLREAGGKPLFAPKYMSLSDLFGILSDLHVEDPVRLVCMLHDICCRHTKVSEPSDNFYSWGQLLLSDFDDVDKNRVAADTLFCNLKDYRALSSPEEYLTEEQRNVLDHFFGHFGSAGDGAQNSAVKENFLRMWQVMGPVYNEFREKLRSEGMAYDGMLYRDAVETFDENRLTAERYVFVGFNVLNTVEKDLLQSIKATGKALFYWDYDHHYLDNQAQEAGEFLREDIKMFGNALDETAFSEDVHPFDNLHRLPQIDVVSAPTNSAQTSFAHDWIQRHLTDTEKETAVVLADEALLPSMLHAIPSEVKELNVTMGLPMPQTRVYRFLYGLLEAGDNNSDGTDNLQWLMQLSDAIDACGLEMKQAGKENRLQEEEEALYRAHLAVNSLARLVQDGTLKSGRRLLVNLLRRVLDTTTIPFHGEPAQGLQVMGVLETRNLDFRHLLVLSVAEGCLPKPPSETSFIPYSLRKAFGLTTIERQTSVYAYYFYRLIQRAEHVTLVYNNGTDGLTQGIPSRFITQLKVELGETIKIMDVTLVPPGQPADQGKLSIIPTEETHRKLLSRFTGTGKLLSASALNTYLACPFHFAMKYIEGIDYQKEDEAEVSTAQFGTLLHKSAEKAYERLCTHGKVIQRSDLVALAKDGKVIEDIVDSAFRTEYFKLPESDTSVLPYNGVHLINRFAICSMLRQLLLLDAKMAPITYIASEKTMTSALTFPDTFLNDGSKINVRIGGFIDRIDQTKDCTRIVDYKTGGQEDKVKSIEDLFKDGKESMGGKLKYIFQAFCYSWALCREHPEYNNVSPALLYLRRSASDDYDPSLELGDIPVTDFRLQAFDEFDEHLQALVDRIFNSKEPYEQSQSEDSCKYCSLQAFCNRHPKKY